MSEQSSIGTHLGCIFNTGFFFYPRTYALTDATSGVLNRTPSGISLDCINFDIISLNRSRLNLYQLSICIKRQPNWPVATLANRPANHPSHPVTPVGQGQALRVLAPLAALTHGRYRVNGDYADPACCPCIAGQFQTKTLCFLIVADRPV